MQLMERQELVIMAAVAVVELELEQVMHCIKSKADQEELVVAVAVVELINLDQHLQLEVILQEEEEEAVAALPTEAAHLVDLTPEALVQDQEELVPILLEQDLVVAEVAAEAVLVQPFLLIAA